MKTKKRISGEIPELLHHVGAIQRSRFKINLIVLVVLVATVIFVAGWFTRDYVKQRKILKERAEKLDAEILEQKKRFEELQNASRQSNLEFKKAQIILDLFVLTYGEESSILNNKFTDDLDLTTKYIKKDPRYRQQSELLNDILSMQKENVGWKIEGLAPEEGFDTLTFVAFILEKNGLLGKHRAVDVLYRLHEVIPRTESPSMGDVVFYDNSYTMFYFMTDSGVPFVIGMTPKGILALKEDFIEKIGYGKINYYKQ